MKSTRRMAIVAALAMAGAWSVARAQGDESGNSSYPQMDPNSKAPGTTAPPAPSGQGSAMPDQGQNMDKPIGQEAANQPELNGTIKGVDKSKRWITVQLQVPQDVTIMKDGKAVGLDAIKMGDDVRAGFDPNTQSITTIHVESKEMKHKK